MRVIFIGGTIFVGAASWHVGARMSADAIAMGVGFVFGAMAGLPIALVLLASQSRQDKPQQPQTIIYTQLPESLHSAPGLQRRGNVTVVDSSAVRRNAERMAETW
jgi:hypothetical protein